MFLFYDCRARPLFPFLHHDALCAHNSGSSPIIHLLDDYFVRSSCFSLFSVFVWFFFLSRTLIHTACPFAKHFFFGRFKFIDITFSEPFCMFSSHLTFRHYKCVCERAYNRAPIYSFFFTDKRESTYYTDIFRSIGIVWCMVCGFDHLKNFRILNICINLFIQLAFNMIGNNVTPIFFSLCCLFLPPPPSPLPPQQ